MDDEILTLHEIAERLGTRWRNLTGLFSRHPDGRPRPIGRVWSRFSGANVNTYSLADFRVWLASHKVDLSHG